MLDAAAIAGALRAGIRLRDKLVVLAIDGTRDAARIEAVASDLALARALGIRVVTVCEAGAGPLPLDAQGPALRLIAAIERHGERGVALPAAGIVTVHRIPAAAVAAAPGTPAMIPVVNTAVLIHLSALGYLPVLFPPIADAEGQAVDLGAGGIAAFVAQFMSAALLVRTPEGGPLDVAGPEAGLPPVPPIVVTSPSSPGRLIADILHDAPDAPADPVGAATSNMVLP